MEKPKMIRRGAPDDVLAKLADLSLPKQHHRRDGTAIANLHSRGTLPDDGRRFGGQTFWRTNAMKRDLDAWLARSAKGHAKLKKGMEPGDVTRVANAIDKRARKSVRLAKIVLAGGFA